MISGTGLDPRYVLLPPIQEMLTDKDTGLPLSGGIVTFYEQNSQTVLKPVYTLSGNGPFSDASYIQLPNPMILSAIGTFVDDNGNDIVPYLFPFDGNTGTTTNTVDLYYITVYSSAGVFQFSRQAWPNTTGSGPVPPVTINGLENFVPNAQFLLHNSVPAWHGNNNIANNLPAPTTVVQNVPSGGVAPSGSSANVTPIAQGGWEFVVPASATSTNSITFIENSIGNNPDVTADPRYNIQVSCTVPIISESYKDLYIVFPDVNKFSTNTTTPNYTFSFQGFTNPGFGPVVVSIRLLKWFGTGGSPSAPTDVIFGEGSVTVNTAQIFNIHGNFGTNAGMTLGTNNDDYVAIALRFPNNIFSLQLSDFVLTSGNLNLSGFPQTTNAQFLSPSTAGFLPSPNADGSSLFLPIRLGSEGFVYDYAEIGNIIAKTDVSTFTGSISTVTNELLADGTQYTKSDYSPLGIPYARLANKIFDSTSGLYRWGSGSTFVNTYISTGLTTQLIIATNQLGPQAVPADSAGPTATGFTFNLNGTVGKSSPNYGYSSYANAAGYITVISNFTNGTLGGVSFADNNTGMTFKDLTSPMNVGPYYTVLITPLAASALANNVSPFHGKYFTFSSSTTNYYFWFNVTNEVDPAPAGKTGIECNLTATMSAIDVGAVIATVLNGFQENPITVTGQPTGGAGSYWTFNSNTTQTAVWYQINGLGSAPTITSNVMVALTGTETAAQVAQKTQVAINQKYFATPNLLNMFLRGSGSSLSAIQGDLDQFIRFGLDSSLAGSAIGSYQLSNNLNHDHVIPSLTGTATAPVGQFIVNTSPGGLQGGSTTGNSFTTAPVTTNANVTGFTGLEDSRPSNMYVTWAIKY